METRKGQAVDQPGLLASLLIAPVAWAVLHMFDYLWIETACRTGILSGTFLGLTGVAWVLIAATLVALIISVGAAIAGYRRLRAVRDPGDEVDLDPVEARSSFLARSALMTSVLFALLIVLTGVPVLMMSPCLAVP